MKFTKKEIFSIPNIMGYVRILLIPVFVTLYVKKLTGWALAALAANIMTDFFDGIVARKFNQITELGKFIDPVADKLSQAAVVVLLAFTYPLLWPVFIIEFIKENTMLFGGGFIFKKKGRKLDGAKWYGKVGTAITDFGLFILLAFPGISKPWANGLIIFIGVCMIITLAFYLGEFRRMWNMPALNTEANIQMAKSKTAVKVAR
ncbi:MAG: CDP-alcohol phosphatidyltransferase family protein [Firmicutes bacterium]|nr:CDP-alcohol phosphatidyltransferase family protein [Bacillota bacterium]